VFWVGRFSATRRSTHTELRLSFGNGVGQAKPEGSTRIGLAHPCPAGSLLSPSWGCPPYNYSTPSAICTLVSRRQGRICYSTKIAPLRPPYIIPLSAKTRQMCLIFAFLGKVRKRAPVHGKCPTNARLARKHDKCA
jgi:hypothetical protein